MPASSRPVAERFWEKVDVRGEDECWPWLGYVQDNGYGKFCTYDGRVRSHLAHRVAYELTCGPIPEDLVVDHVTARGCTRLDCVNPRHLEPVRQGENVRRGESGQVRRANRESRTRCRHGHRLSPENTYRRPNGERVCRTCQRASAARHRTAKRRERSKETSNAPA